MNMMSFEVKLKFCIIFALWTSVSGEIHTLRGDWSADIAKCGSGGEDSRTFIYNINDQIIDDLDYDQFDENSIVKAGGRIELKTGSIKPIILRELLLDKYSEGVTVKIFEGSFHIDGGANWSTQKVRMEVKFIISRNDPPLLQNYVYAGSWLALTCTSSISHIDYMKIVV